MNVHLLASAGGVSFLCLLAGLLPLEAMLAAEELVIDTQKLNPELGTSISISAKTGNLVGILQMQPNTWQTRGLTYNQSQVESTKAADSKQNSNQLDQPHSNLVFTDLPTSSSLDSHSSVPQLIAQQASSSNNTEGIDNSTPATMAQVTSVSQLSDVQLTDWAFQALQSLVERYGCIVGYPDSTYRGNRALTRYEFAAGLNACLDRVNELIATATSNLVSREDLATLQRLQAEFATELTTLRGRVDAVEAQTAELEANQFSTTTKLSGEVIAAGIGATGGAPGGDDANIILVDRVRLNLTTSFTGKDSLITGLQAYNFLGGLEGTGSVQDTLGLASPILSASTARVSFEPQFPGIDPKTLTPISANDIELYKLLYIFPVAEKLTLFAGTAAETSDAFPAITPFYGEGQEAVSRFASLNPVVRVSGGTSGTGLASAAGFIWNVSDQLDLRALYGSVNANIPNQAADILPGVSGNPLGAGLFGGSTVAAAQLTFRPSENLDIGVNYANSYHEINILGTGLVNADVGGALGGLPLGIPVKLNSVGATLTWRFAPKIAFSTYGAALFVDDSSGRVDASSTFTSWMAGLHFTDVFNEGNAAGIIFGQPLYRSSVDGDAVLTPAGEDRATPYHLEAYFRFRVNDNISITPGAFVLFNPEGNENNDTTTVGVLRTTFTF